jgi:hypothetical protein
MLTIIHLFLILLGFYIGAGVIFSIYFFFKGASRLDPIIKESKWTVRLLLVPGAIATWILLLPKLIKNN